MKCICTQRCQFRGIVSKGTILDLTEAELKIPHVAASFKRVAEGKPDVAATAAKPGKPAEQPLTAADGAPLPQGAQISTDELKRRLEGARVAVPPNATRQEMFVLLQQALEPNKSKHGE